MDDMLIAMVHKGAEKIPVQITDLDDPRLKALCDTHGADNVHVNGVSMAYGAVGEGAAEVVAAPAAKASRVRKPAPPKAAAKAPAKKAATKKAKR